MLFPATQYSAVHEKALKSRLKDVIALACPGYNVTKRHCFRSLLQCLLTGMESCSRIAKNKDKEPGTSYPTDRRDIGAACFQI